MARPRKNQQKKQEEKKEQPQPLPWGEAEKPYVLTECIRFVDDLSPSSARFLAGYFLSLYYQAVGLYSFTNLLSDIQKIAIISSETVSDEHLQKIGKELAGGIEKFVKNLEIARTESSLSEQNR